MKQRIISLILVLSLLLAVPAMAAVEVDISQYSQYPLVTDGSVTLSIAVPRNDTYGIDAKDMWWWNWWEQKSGVKFEVEQISQSALSERKKIMLAAGDLPDVLWGFGFNTSELLRYGDTEEVLLDLKPYITPEIMPFLSQFVEKYTQTMNYIATPTGAVYSLPYYRAVFAGYSSDMYIDQNLLDEYDLEIPTTLDDFTAMLRLFKEKNPEIVALGGGVNFDNPFYYILNAYGFVGEGNNNGEGITVRGGVPVIPAGDPLFKEALATMKLYYDEGLISADFFTIDGVTVNAMMAEGKLGIYGRKAYMATPDYEDFSHWTAVKPLTSAYNDKQQWKGIDPIGIGGWVVSADTELAELSCRLADFLYSNIGTMYSKYGPPHGSSDTLGMTNGVDYDPNDLIATTYRRMDAELGVYSSAVEYEAKMPSGLLSVGNDAYDLESGMYIANWIRSKLFGYEIDQTADLTSKIFNPYHIDNNARITCNTNLFPYEIPAYPGVVYFSEADNNRIIELRSVIDPYIKGEVAKFITGTRRLDEVEAFQKELRNMGFDELEQLYKDYYAG